MGESGFKESMLRNRKIKIFSLGVIDFFAVFVAYYIAFIFTFYLNNITLKEITNGYKGHFLNIIIAAIIYIVCFFSYKQYRSIWTLAGFDEFSRNILATVVGMIVNLIISSVSSMRMPFTITILAAIIIGGISSGIRLSYRIIRRAIIYSDLKGNEAISNVLVVGGGSGGSLVLNEYKKYPNFGKKVVAFVDDDRQKRGTFIGGVKVLGNRDDIKDIVEAKNIDEIIIAIASIDKDSLREIIEKCKDVKAKVKIMPGVSEMIDGKFSINSIRDVDVEDLLGRDAIKLDHEGISDYIENKVVIVTGGGGSIGSELCRQIARFKPKQLIIFDIYENNAYDIQNELRRNYPELNLKTLIGSVRDKKRLRLIFEEYKPQVVFHAAAHKHVPLMEESPAEAIKNNVIGTLNVVEVAHINEVERFVLISTDKAVNPTNVMGATKRMCEMIIQAMNEESDTEFVAVRFGNVLGSNGSVVPLFKKQIAKGGPVTLTHKDITRYFMTIPEASQLVLQAGAYAKGGEIFVLDMGKPVRIYDLAENLIKLSGFEPHKDIEIEVTGLRPGEKLYEELLMDEEGLTQTKHEKIFIGKPSEFNIMDVVQNTQALLDLAVKGDKDKLKKKLKEVVPTFVEPDELNSKVKIKEIDKDEEVAVDRE